MRRLLEVLPLEFRVLYRQFLLRVVDLEALSLHADLPRYLGQFAGVLIMFSLIEAGAALLSGANTMTPQAKLLIAWHVEQWILSTTMLIVGLVVVFTWDSMFPDRRDALVLGPLPVRASTILAAKAATSASVVGGAILAFNFASGIAWPVVLGGTTGFFRFFAAYWGAIFAASIFIYASVLAVQGFAALLLPRRVFLRVSALLQIAAFGLFLGGYFSQPLLDSPGALAAPQHHRLIAASPGFWFFALLNQGNGSLPEPFGWLAHRAWAGVGIAMAGAVVSLLFCYPRTLRKTIEGPDLAPSRRAFRFNVRFGSALDTAIVVFAARTLIRSRQHRLAFAFYIAIVFALTVLLLRPSSLVEPGTINVEFICATIVMVGFSVAGLRKVFALPIWLTANWIFRIAEIRPGQEYLRAARRALLVLGVLPVWCVAALVSIHFRPWLQITVHLVVLLLLGMIASELSLIGFRTIPFTCSYLPGKVNVQFIFWGMVIVVFPLLVVGSIKELQVLQKPHEWALLLSVLALASIGLWATNNYRAKSVVLDFEESPPDGITSLGLSVPGTPRKTNSCLVAAEENSTGGLLHS